VNEAMGGTAAGGRDAGTAADLEPFGDMPADRFRELAGQVLDRVTDYLSNVERWPVLARARPGELRAALPAAPPAHGEPIERILEDYDRLVPAATTHWNHPGFFAYFAVTGSGPGILAELLSAALNVNAMVWRTGPAATELEEVATDWLRQLLGLGPGLDGTISDTASTSTLHALAAARESLSDLEIRQYGLAGRPDVPRLRVYCSQEAHSSVDKAVLALGLGLDGTRRVATDGALRLDPAELAAAIRADRLAGIRPMAVVATVGTTSTTAVDPVPAIAELCAAEGIWLHVDAAYGGAAGVVPEYRWVLDGADRADSLVVNPHKWLFVPIDCSVLYTRRPDVLRRAFSLVPDYLTTAEGEAARNLMDYGVALGRRFRALKLWFVLRAFGADGLAARIREHIRLAQRFGDWIDADAAFERLAPSPLSVVVFRHRPAGLEDGPALDRHNERLLDAVNATGEVFLSHTRVRGRYALRLAVGNLRTRERHVRRAFELLKETAVVPMLS
jgi:aromatic-L-amino-acid decarboxylase